MSYDNPTVPTISDPRGIDRAIQFLQLTLGTKLTWLDKSWGRVYTQKKRVRGAIRETPVVYDNNGEYFPVEMNDNLVSQSFFEVGERSPLDFAPFQTIFYEHDVSIVFWGNLKKIDPILNLNYNFTEKLIEEVKDVLTKRISGFSFKVEIVNITEERDEVFAPYTFQEENLQHLTNPYFGFKVDLNIILQQDCDTAFPATFCDALNQFLTATDKNECILPTYDFSDTNVTDNFTVLQENDLTNLLCGGPVGGIIYQLPPLTGQIVSQVANDDGDNLANGVYDFVAPSNGQLAQLDTTAPNPYVTLLNNNTFLNKNRFTDSVGDQEYGSGGNGSLLNYIIDHHTRLGWLNLADDMTSRNWATTISFAASYVRVGFSDWRTPNMYEMLSIVNLGENKNLNYAPFNDDQTAEYHTSTSLSVAPTTTAVSWSNANFRTSTVLKITSLMSYKCRNHF